MNKFGLYNIITEIVIWHCLFINRLKQDGIWFGLIQCNFQFQFSILKFQVIVMYVVCLSKRFISHVSPLSWIHIFVLINIFFTHAPDISWIHSRHWWDCIHGSLGVMINLSMCIVDKFFTQLSLYYKINYYISLYKYTYPLHFLYLFHLRICNSSMCVCECMCLCICMCMCMHILYVCMCLCVCGKWWEICLYKSISKCLLHDFVIVEISKTLVKSL